MYDREKVQDRQREKALWQQSGARYRVSEEKEAGFQTGKRSERTAHNFETDAAEKSKKHLPVHLAALENAYGNVEFARLKDGSLTVSFAKRQAFGEPVSDRDLEKLHMERCKRSRSGGMPRIQNSRSPLGAEAFVLRSEKSAARQVEQVVKTTRSPLEQIARSMASRLLPVGREVMPKEQMAVIVSDLERTARRVLEKDKADKGKKQEKKEEVRPERRSAEKTPAATTSEAAIAAAMPAATTAAVETAEAVTAAATTARSATAAAAMTEATTAAAATTPADITTRGAAPDGRQTEEGETDKAGDRTGEGEAKKG